jgi:TP901 family phage tail tape measure protein
MSTVQLGFDLAPNAKQAAQTFLETLMQQKKNILDLGAAVVSFNKSGEAVAATYKQMSSEGIKFTAVLNKTKEKLEVVKATVNTTAAAMQKLKEAKKEALKSEANVAIKGITEVQNFSPISISQANSIEASLKRVRDSIESGKVSLKRFQELYAQISTNPKSLIPNLTSEESSLVASLRRIVTATKEVNKEVSNEAEKTKAKLKDVLTSQNQEISLFAGKIGTLLSNSLASFVGNITSRGVTALIGELSQSINAAKEYSIAIARVETISQKVSLSTDRWASSLRAISSSFGFSQIDTANAAYVTLSNQVAKGADVFQFLEKSSKFALASVSTLTDAVNLGSSALKAFNLPVSSAERVFASFFKTIELGRIKASDIANTFGRVAATANQVGVSLDEVNAALATITIRGILPAEAMTLVNNIMLKLIRPTDEMKSLLEEWGVASGTAAVATFGFSGVLKRLEIEAQKGSTRLGDLFNQIRAVRGAFSLSGSAFGDFTANLEEIRNAKVTYDNAAEIVTKSFGQRFEIEMNKVKVYFTEEFGDSIIRSIVRISDAFGGLDNIVRNVVNILFSIGKVGITVGASFTALNTVFGAYNSILALTAARSAVAAAQTNALSTATDIAAAKAAAARAAWTLYLGAFGVGFAVGEVLRLSGALETLQEKAERIKKGIESRGKETEIKFGRDAAKDPETIAANDVTEVIRRNFESRFQLALTYYSQQQRLATEVRNRSIQNLNDVTEATKVSASSYTDLVNKKLSELRRVSIESQEIIRGSAKAIEGLDRQIGSDLFGKRLQFASEGFINEQGLVFGEQKTAIIKERIISLQKLAREKFAEGSRESVEDARRIYDEIRQQQTSLFEAEVAIRKREFQEKVRRGAVMPTSTFFDPVTGQLQKRYELAVDTGELERRLLSVKNQQIQAERRLQEIQEERRKSAEEEELRERSKLKAVQEAFAAIQKLSFVDKDMNVPEIYKKDPSRLLADFDRQAEIIRKNTSDVDIATAAQVSNTIFTQRKALEQQISAFSIENKIKEEAQKLEIAKKYSQDQITFAKERFDEGNAQITQRATELQKTLDSILTLDTKKIEPGFSPEDRNLNWRVRKQETERQVENVKKLGAEFQQAVVDFNTDRSVENLKRLKEAYLDFTLNYEKYAKRVNQVVPDDQAQRIQDLLNQVERLEASFQTRSIGLQGLLDVEQAGKNIGAALDNIPQRFQLLAEAAGNSAPLAAQNINTITASASELITNLDIAIQKLNQLKTDLPPIRSERAEGKFFGGQMSFVPRGSDNVPAMINKNEFIVTSEATKRFAPILRAMNNLSPELTSRGGSITNIGDVNVTVNGGSNSQQTIREIGKGLRRELKRGTMKWD